MRRHCAVLTSVPLPTRVARWLKLAITPIWALTCGALLLIRLHSIRFVPYPLGALVYRNLLFVTVFAVMFKGWGAAAWPLAEQLTFVWTLDDRYGTAWMPQLAFGIAMIR